METLSRAGFLMGLVLAGPASAADKLAEVMRMHVEVVGGKQRIEALAAIRASGVVMMEGKRVKFTLTVARPNLLRLESEADGQKFLQAYDGVDTPWELDKNAWPVRYKTMSDSTASRIIADAEYDGPLIAGQARGFKVEVAGQMELEGRKYTRLHVNWRLRETFSLLIDPETYLIAYRIDTRPLAEGRQEETFTRYEDYRPVDGVLIPHDIITIVDGRVTERLLVERIESNPLLSPEMFTRPDRTTSPLEPEARKR